MHGGGSDLRLNDGLFVKLYPVGRGLTVCLWVGKRELIVVLFVRLFDLCLFGFVGFVALHYTPS